MSSVKQNEVTFILGKNGPQPPCSCREKINFEVAEVIESGAKARGFSGEQPWKDFNEAIGLHLNLLSLISDMQGFRLAEAV